jgi:pimeloyl-ACP methyl ester carboxylesterase
MAQNVHGDFLPAEGLSGQSDAVARANGGESRNDAKSAMSDVRDDFVTTRDGRRLHVLGYGGPSSRTPVICIPGLRSNLHSFDVIASHIAKTRRVVCIGMRGRGHSDYDSEPRHYGLTTETSDVYWVLKQANIPRAILLGVSRGGFTALALGVRTNLAAGLIFVDSGPQMEVAGMSRFTPDLARDVSFASWDAAASSLKARHKAWYPTMSDEDWRVLARQLYREENGRVITDSDQGIGDALKSPSAAGSSAGSWSAWSLFESMPPVPILVARGEFSDFVLESTVDRMKAMKPGLAAVTVKGRGHPPLMNEPDLIAAVDSFLEGIP